MKNVSVVHTLLLAALTSLLLLAGCQSKPTVATPVSQATATPVTTGADDWARIQATGKLVVGTSADYPPFSFYTNNFMFDGFDVALAREIGRRLGIEVELKDFAFEGLLNALQLGQIDMAIAALSVTPARERMADFTRVYYVGEDAFLARADATLAPIRQTQDLVNYRIGVQTGSVYATWLRSTLVDPGLLAPDHVIAYNDIGRAIIELGQNQLDLVMMDAMPAQQLARQGSGRIVGRGLNRESLAIAVRKGSASLRQQLDDTLGKLQVEGFVTKLAAQYLALDPPEVIAPPSPVPPTATPLPINTPVPTATTTPVPPTVTPQPTAAPCVDGMAYIADLSYDDGGMSRPPVLAPGQGFTKSWRIRNSGTCAWQPGFALVYIGGNTAAADMGGQAVTIGQVAPVNSVVDLSVNLVAPTMPGVYQGIWQMVNDQGVPFGQRIWVGIQIPGPPTPTPQPNADINFWADRSNISEGERAILYWRVTNVRAVYVYEAGQPWEPNGVVGEGSREVWPRRSTVYELRVIRMDNSPELRQLRIDVAPIQVLPEPVAPLINTFNASQDQIVIGSCVGLSWDVAGTITQLRLYRSGALLVDNVGQRSYTDCPNFGGPVTYRLEASNGRTARYRDVTVTVLVRQPR